MVKYADAHREADGRSDAFDADEGGQDPSVGPRAGAGGRHRAVSAHPLPARLQRD